MRCTACAKFCGVFRDEHADSPAASEDEEDPNDLFKPAEYKQAVAFQSKNAKTKSTKKQQFDTVSPEYFWRAKQTRLEVPSESKQGKMSHNVFVDAIVCRNSSFTDLQLKHLRTMQYLHTLELVNSGLTDCPPDLAEIDNLKVIDFSSNRIEVLHKNLMRVQRRHSSLRRLSLDDNRIKFIEIGTFTGDAVNDLLVLSLAKNHLVYLPNDFLFGAAHLELLDLSFNKLESVPDAMMMCKQLRSLDLCNNDLKKLQEGVKGLVRLRKLFLQGNDLRKLPKSLGECRNLEKLWVGQNKLRFLPFELIDIWRTEGGMLDEIAVDDNPLVMPNLTAYLVGGPDQMFKLFKEQRDEAQARLREQEERMAAVKAAEDKNLALQDIDVKFREEEAEITALTDGFAHAPTPDGKVVAWLGGDNDSCNQSTVGDIDGLGKEDTDNPQSWYFYEIQDNEKVMTNLRSVESGLLLLKKAFYVDQLKRAVHTRYAGNPELAQELPENKKKFLEPTFTAVDFHSRVHVMEFDLCFCLFASSARTLARSATTLMQLFCGAGGCHEPVPKEEREEGLSPWTCRKCDKVNKREQERCTGCQAPMPQDVKEEGANWTCKICKWVNAKVDEKCRGLIMKRKEFDTLCARIPITLSTEMQGQMWRWMKGCRKDEKEDMITQLEFIAALQIHDIFQKDPYITRVAGVLKLLYYNLDSKRFEEQLRNKCSPTATPTDFMDFPSDEDDDKEESKKIPDFFKGSDIEIPLDALHDVEGERRRDAVSEAWLATPGLSSFAQAKTTGKKHNRLISMTESQYWDRQAESEGLVDANANVYEVDSDDLSDSDQSDSSFSAGECFERLEEIEFEEEKDEEGDKHKPLEVRGEHDIKKLMDLPVSKIGMKKAKEKTAPLLDGNRRRQEREKKAAKLAELREHRNTNIVRDPRFFTNMLPVRKALRETYRNLPFYEFVSFVNFLLRRTKDIKHCKGASNSTSRFWSFSDPSLKFALGDQSLNPYPTAVLREMGFVLIFDCYWAWPAKQLRSLSERNRARFVSPNSPGLDENRLDDIIKLVSQCKQYIDTKGRGFRGHCP